ncbi:MAG TPA: GNAT family N-acetyltransferase [Rhodopila sp.]|nr:GNAT family N-acetyltransferase [Rhodopila sp.]
MHVRLLTELSDLDHVLPDWRTLYHASGRSPFQNPELHRIWWQHLGLREGWTPLIALGYHYGTLVAVASFAIRRSRMLRILEWAGTAAFDYPDILLSDSADPGALWQAVRQSGYFDIARLRWVRSDTTSRQPLTGFAHKIGDDQLIHAINLAHSNSQAWFASLPKSMRAEHREKLRLIEKRGPVAMRQATQPEAIRKAVQTLVRFKAEWSRSRGTETVYLSDNLDLYFEDVAMAACRDQTLHLTTLDCGDESLAVHLGFAGRDGLYYYVSSYDIAAAKLSPGRVHMNLLVMWAIDNGLHRFDFLRGDADYKTRLGTASRCLEDYMFSHGLIGSAALQAFLWQQNRRAARAEPGQDMLTAGARGLSNAVSGGADA